MQVTINGALCPAWDPGRIRHGDNGPERIPSPEAFPDERSWATSDMHATPHEWDRYDGRDLIRRGDEAFDEIEAAVERKRHGQRSQKEVAEMIVDLVPGIRDERSPVIHELVGGMGLILWGAAGPRAAQKDPDETLPTFGTLREALAYEGPGSLGIGPVSFHLAEDSDEALRERRRAMAYGAARGKDHHGRAVGGYLPEHWTPARQSYGGVSGTKGLEGWMVADAVRVALEAACDGEMVAWPDMVALASIEVGEFHRRGCAVVHVGPSELCSCAEAKDTGAVRVKRTVKGMAGELRRKGVEVTDEQLRQRVKRARRRATEKLVEFGLLADARGNVREEKPRDPRSRGLHWRDDAEAG